MRSPPIRLWLTGAVLVSAAFAQAASPARTGDDLRAEVRNRLEARLPADMPRIDVEVNGGAVTLEGAVDVFVDKEIASEVAASVPGVRAVVNELRVTPSARPDEEIAGNVRWALKTDPATAGLDLKVAVRDGEVVLRGTVETIPQKRLAAWVASDRIGVRNVRNEIQVDSPSRLDAEIREELSRHYAQSPVFDNDEITVEVTGGEVRLSGKIDNALQKIWAQNDAWIAGVREVRAGELEVWPPPYFARERRVAGPSDEDIRRAIVTAFVNDPRVVSFNPRVNVDHQVVTLDGTVTSRKARQAAVQIARSMGGVIDVVDRLEVAPAPGRPDEAIQTDLRRSLGTSAALANNRVKVEVENAHAELTGFVDSYYEKWLAGDLADRMPGLATVENRLVVQNQARTRADGYYYFPRGSDLRPWIHPVGRDDESKTDLELAAEVRHALSLNPLTDGTDILVTSLNRTVTLSGPVDSAAERKAAIDSAYLAGAQRVKSALRVVVAPSSSPQSFSP